MNRRSFLKSLATACGAAVVCPGELLKGKEPMVTLADDRSVTWGMAPCDLFAFQYVSLMYRPMRCYDWCHWNPIPTVIVKTTKPIKMGQLLVWNPDGTVRGINK